jgi:hypothetical protein
VVGRISASERISAVRGTETGKSPTSKVSPAERALPDAIVGQRLGSDYSLAAACKVAGNLMTLSTVWISLATLLY